MGCRMIISSAMLQSIMICSALNGMWIASEFMKLLGWSSRSRKQLGMSGFVALGAFLRSNLLALLSFPKTGSSIFTRLLLPTLGFVEKESISASRLGTTSLPRKPESRFPLMFGVFGPWERALDTSPCLTPRLSPALRLELTEAGLVEDGLLLGDIAGLIEEDSMEFSLVKREGLVLKRLKRLTLTMESVGTFGVESSKPPYIMTLFSCSHEPCLNLWMLSKLVHSLASVSNASRGKYYVIAFFLPPITSMIDPTNIEECWQRGDGLDFQGAGTQSQRPFLCFRNPQLSANGFPSTSLPPNTTTMLAAAPEEHSAAEWQTLAQGASPQQITSCHINGGLAIFKIQQSLTDLSPTFPPKTIRYGLENERV